MIYVFGGESLWDAPQELKNNLICRPPINRGVLEKIKFNAKNPPLVLILDGVYGSSLSITATECRQFLERGGRLVGASSIGALRASELWSVGMIGVGQVYNMLRIGYIRSDADIAVAYDERTFREITISIIHVRSILSILEEREDISSILSRHLLKKAHSLIWFERYWDSLIEEWKKHFNLTEEVVELLIKLHNNPLYHPKKRDALEALHLITAKRWPSICI